MNREKIIELLEAVGHELDELGLDKDIYFEMIGGGFVITQMQNSRESTDDVDGRLLFIDDPRSSMEYLFLKNAVRGVATSYGLAQNWLSDTIADFLTIAGPPSERTEWRVFSRFHVLVPSKEYILAHKLLAGREKDEDDILLLLKILNITTRSQACTIVDRYITDDATKQGHGVEQTLDRYF